MEKKESRKAMPPTRETPAFKKEANLLPKAGNLSSRFFGIIKLILGLCFLPFVYAASASFLRELNLIQKDLQGYFWQGAISFIIIYIFIYEPAIIYKRGQRLLELFFSFFKPLVKVAPQVLPIYTIVIFVIYLLTSPVFKSKEWLNYYLFLFGFSSALHLAFSAQSMRTKQENPFKVNYLFGFSLIYIINIVLLSFLLNIIFREFSFVNFFNRASQISRDILFAVFKQLFL
jgi:hypothetical protein